MFERMYYECTPRHPALNRTLTETSWSLRRSTSGECEKLALMYRNVNLKAKYTGSSFVATE